MKGNMNKLKYSVCVSVSFLPQESFLDELELELDLIKCSSLVWMKNFLSLRICVTYLTSLSGRLGSWTQIFSQKPCLLCVCVLIFKRKKGHTTMCLNISLCTCMYLLPLVSVEDWFQELQISKSVDIQLTQLPYIK